jgi:hypothetical protein
MAGQEIEGDLWDQTFGLDLPFPAVRVGVITRFPTFVQNLGSRDPRLTKLALDQAARSCQVTHVSKRMFYARSD